jgi:hypothetical protein
MRKPGTDGTCFCREADWVPAFRVQLRLMKVVTTNGPPGAAAQRSLRLERPEPYDCVLRPSRNINA